MRILVTSPNIPFEEQLNGGIGDNLIHELVGDIQRIKVYPELGFQLPQDIPDVVWRAYETLISLRYDKHLLAGPPVRRSVQQSTGNA